MLVHRCRRILLAVSMILMGGGYCTAFAGACDWFRESADDIQNRGHDMALLTARAKAADAATAGFQIATRPRAAPSATVSGGPAVPPPLTDHVAGSMTTPRPDLAGLPSAEFSAALASGPNRLLSRRYAGNPYQLALIAARRAARLGLDGRPALSGPDLVERAALAITDERLDTQQRRAIAIQATLEELLMRLDAAVGEFKEQLSAKECLRYFDSQVTTLRGASIDFSDAKNDIEDALALYDPLFRWNQKTALWHVPPDHDDLIPFLSPWRDILNPVPGFHGQMISLFRGWSEDALFVRNETSYEVWYEARLSTRLTNMQRPFVELSEEIPPGQTPEDALNYAEQNRDYLSGLLNQLAMLVNEDDDDVKDEVDAIVAQFGHAAVPITFNLSFLHGYARGGVIPSEARVASRALSGKIDARAQLQAAAHAEALRLEAVVDAINVPAFIRLSSP